MPKAKVIKDDTMYSIVAPDGTIGEAFEYGFRALVEDHDEDIFTCLMENSGDEVLLERVTQTETVACVVKHVENVIDDEDGDDPDGADVTEIAEVEN